MKLSLALSFVLVGTARATTPEGWVLGGSGKSCKDACAGNCIEQPPKNINTKAQMEFALAIATGQATYDCNSLVNGNTDVSPYVVSVSGTNTCSFTPTNGGGSCNTNDSSVQRLCCCHDATLCPGPCTTDTDCTGPATCIGNICTVTSSVGGNCDVPGNVCAFVLTCIDKKCKVPLLGNGCGTTNDNCVAPGQCVSNTCKIPLGGSGCGTTEDCVSGVCTTDNTCKTPLNPGDAGCDDVTTFCNPPADCVNNVCVLQEGESGCVDNTDCDADLDCVDGVCQEPSGVEGCSSDANCDQGEECVIVSGAGTCQAVDGVRGCWARIEIWNFFWKWFICLIKWLWNKIF